MTAPSRVTSSRRSRKVRTSGEGSHRLRRCEALEDERRRKLHPVHTDQGIAQVSAGGEALAGSVNPQRVVLAGDAGGPVGRKPTRAMVSSTGAVELSSSAGARLMRNQWCTSPARRPRLERGPRGPRVMTVRPRAPRDDRKVYQAHAIAGAESPTVR